MPKNDARHKLPSNERVREDLLPNGITDVKKFGRTVAQRMIARAKNNYDVDDVDASSEEKVSVTIPRVKYISPIQRPSSLGSVRLPTAAVSLHL